MRIDAGIGTCDRLDIVQQEIRSDDQARRGCDHKISVVVSDGSYMTSELLARALTRIKTLSVLKCTVNFDQAFEAIVTLRPDVAVLGLHFANGPYKALELLRRLREVSAKTRCVLLTDETERDGVIEAFRAGAGCGGACQRRAVPECRRDPADRDRVISEIKVSKMISLAAADEIIFVYD